MPGNRSRRLLDELRCRPRRRRHDDRTDRCLLLPEEIDRLIHIDRVAIIGQPQDGGIVDPQCAIGLRHAGKALVAERIVLAERDNLIWLQLSHLQEITHRCIGLLREARPVVENIAIRGIMPHHGAARERRVEQHPLLERVGNCDFRGRRAKVAKETEHLVLFQKLLHHGHRPRRVEAVIGRNQLEQSAIHATGIVDLGKGDVDPLLVVLAVLLRAPGVGDDDAETNFAVGDATRIVRRNRLGRRRGGAGRGGCDGVGERRRRGRRRRRTDGLFEIGNLAFSHLAIGLPGADRCTTVGDVALELPRDVAALRFVIRGFPDHRLEFVDDELDARPRHVLASLRRADDGSNAACEIAYDAQIVSGRTAHAACEQDTG